MSTKFVNTLKPAELYTHTHTHTQIKCCQAFKQIGTICFAKFFKFCVVTFFAIFCGLNPAHAVDYPFSITTTSLSVNDAFNFQLAVSGTFYVDCGSGGTLSGTGVSGTTITRNNATAAIYTCTYSTGGVKTIRFGGRATGYSSYTRDLWQDATILFYVGADDNIRDINAAKIASISGSLGAIFPTLGSGNSLQPIFWHTFHKAVNITSLPETLFNGITGNREEMFSWTFEGMNITSIPSNLFSGVSGCADAMFSSTFRDCTRLTSIPENLFSGVTCAYNYMFGNTFYGCTNLSGYIPPSTFSGLIDAGHPIASNFFYQTFYGTNLVTSCPSGTTQYISGYEGSGNTTWNGKVSCISNNATYTVTYSCGDGTGNPPTDSHSPYSYGSSVTTLSNTCTPPANVYFVKWNCGGTNVNAGSVFTITGNTTCTAQYGNVCGINGDLYSGYTQLEYIESTGTQYINTRQSVRFGDEFYFDYMKMSNTTSTENKGYGVLSKSISGGGRIIDNVIQIWAAANVAYSPSLSASAALQKRYVENWIISSGKLTSTLTEVGTSNVYTLTANYSGFTSSMTTSVMYLFRDYDSDYAHPSAMRIYLTWLKRSNGNYAFYLIPAKRNSDNVLGMCDTVTGDFLTNSGSGTFTAGPVVGTQTVNLTWYDNNTTISGPASCTVGGTFLPPTPPARTGYVFTGWKVKTQ